MKVNKQRERKKCKNMMEGEGEWKKGNSVGEKDLGERERGKNGYMYN